MKETRRSFLINWNGILLQLKDAKIKELKNVIPAPKCSLSLLWEKLFRFEELKQNKTNQNNH